MTGRAWLYIINDLVSQVRNLWYKSNKEGISPPKGEL